MRTQEQIIADCEKRMNELEQTYQQISMKDKCKSCRWYVERDHDGYIWSSKRNREYYATCHEPLVKGFNRHGFSIRTFPIPCGPERPLWQPKISIWIKIKYLCKFIADCTIRQT